MDGPSPARRSRRAHQFAEELIAGSTDAVQSRHGARLGHRTFTIGLRTEDDLGTFIRDAFLPTAPATDSLTLAISRAGELARLPSLEWAREWINAGQVVPLEVTYPYRVFLDRQVGIAYALDQATGRGAVWIRRPAELDLRSFITPFRLMMSWLANLVDGEIVHASAAVVDGRGVALSGASGSGKSTLAIGLGLAGHGFIADDCVLLHGGRVHAVYARAKLDGRSESLLGAHGLDLATLHDTPRAKRFFRVQDLGEDFVAEHSLDALGFPALSTRSGHYRVSARRAYRMLSVDSLRELHGGSARNRLRLAQSAARLPAFRLLLGTSTAQNVEAVRAMLGERSDRVIGQREAAVSHGA